MNLTGFAEMKLLIFHLIFQAITTEEAEQG